MIDVYSSILILQKVLCISQKKKSGVRIVHLVFRLGEVRGVLTWRDVYKRRKKPMCLVLISASSSPPSQAVQPVELVNSNYCILGTQCLGGKRQTSSKYTKYKKMWGTKRHKESELILWIGSRGGCFSQGAEGGGPAPSEEHYFWDLKGMEEPAMQTTECRLPSSGNSKGLGGYMLDEPSNRPSVGLKPSRQGRVVEMRSEMSNSAEPCGPLSLDFFPKAASSIWKLLSGGVSDLCLYC